MSYMVVLVVDDIEQCPAVLEAWEEAGGRGVTILPSSGLGRLRQSALRDDMPILPSFQDLFQREEVQHRTLFSVVETQELVDRLVAATENTLGNLDEPHTGFLFVVPVLQARGFGSHQRR